MAARGSQFSRIIAYFRTADPEEVDYVLARGVKILAERKEGPAAVPPAARTRRPRTSEQTTIPVIPNFHTGASTE